MMHFTSKNDYTIDVNGGLDADSSSICHLPSKPPTKTPAETSSKPKLKASFVFDDVFVFEVFDMGY